MAMNKAEKAHVAALEKQLAEARAFRRTDVVDADLLPPEGYGPERFTFGFRSFVYGIIEYRAEPMASSSIYNYRYRSSGVRESGGSHGSMRLCSTRLLALQRARNQLEQNVAEALARLDAEIEAERDNPTPHPEAA